MIKSIFCKRSINFYSSFSFLASILFSYNRNCYLIHISTIISLLTSLVYHSTYNNICKKIDIIINNFFICYYIILCATWNYYYYLAIINTIICGIIYIKFSYTKYDKYSMYWHCLIHVIGNIGIISVTQSCYINPYCSLCN